MRCLRGPHSFLFGRGIRHAIIAVVLVFAAASSATGEPVAEDAAANTCSTYAYVPRDYGSNAFADAAASCPSVSEYKTLSVCLIKQGVGVIACSHDSGYQANYYAGVSSCYGSVYYYTQATLTNQAPRYSNSVYITC